MGNQHKILWDDDGEPVWCVPAGTDPAEMVYLATPVGALIAAIQTVTPKAA